MVTEVQGRSPWYLAWERLRRNKIALGFGVLFLLLVLFSVAAPLWADHVAHTGPNQNHITTALRRKKGRVPARAKDKVRV